MMLYPAIDLLEGRAVRLEEGRRDRATVFSERPLEGLDAVEADQIISTVAAYADEWDDKLVAEFGGRVYGRI